MDSSSRKPASTSKANMSGSEFQRRRNLCLEACEPNENEFPFLYNGAPRKASDFKKEPEGNVNLSTSSGTFGKKVLAERMEDPSPDSSSRDYLGNTPQEKTTSFSNQNGTPFRISPVSLYSYDPITHYTSPRPEFLRFNPNQRRELLERIEGEMRREEEESPESSLSSANASSGGGNESDAESEDDKELEEERPFLSRVAWNFVLLFGVLMLIFYSMGSGFHPSFREGYESSAEAFQKNQGLFPENMLGAFMGLSRMCPFHGGSVCNLEEINLILLKDDGDTGHNDSIVKVKAEYDEHEQRDSRPQVSSSNQSTTELQAMRNNTTCSSCKYLQESQADGVRFSSSNQDDEFLLRNSAEFNESSKISQIKSDDAPPLADDGKEESGFPKPSLSFVSNGAFRCFSIFLGLLAILVSVSSSFYKYFGRPNLKFSLENPSLAPIAETKEKMIDFTPMKEEFTEKMVENKANRIPNEHHLWSFDHSNIELNEVSGIRAPRVELLGEFSPFNQKLKTEEFSDSQFSYYKRRQTTKGRSPAIESKILNKEEVYSNRSEASDTDNTPLRRSSRLRRRITSP